MQHNLSITYSKPVGVTGWMIISSVQSHPTSHIRSVTHHSAHPAPVTPLSPLYAGRLHPSGGGPPAGPWPGGLPAAGERYKGQGTPACPAHRCPQGRHQGRGPAPAERPQRGRRVQGEWRRRCSQSLVVDLQLVALFFVFFKSVWLFECLIVSLIIDVLGFLCQFLDAFFLLLSRLNLLLMLFGRGGKGAEEHFCLFLHI